jgi:uncharacterized protein YgiM (DUF1202 family)
MKKLLFVLPVCGYLLLAGCLKEGHLKDPPKERQEIFKFTSTHVIINDTVYYMSGPQQARPPEGRFKVGTKVTLIRKAGSYSLVRSEDGREGYITTDSLEPIGPK